MVRVPDDRIGLMAFEPLNFARHLAGIRGNRRGTRHYVRSSTYASGAANPDVSPPANV
jgi:hypothetical protein